MGAPEQRDLFLRGTKHYFKALRGIVFELLRLGFEMKIVSSVRMHVLSGHLRMQVWGMGFLCCKEQQINKHQGSVLGGAMHPISGSSALAQAHVTIPCTHVARCTSPKQPVQHAFRCSIHSTGGLRFTSLVSNKRCMRAGGELVRW